MSSSPDDPQAKKIIIDEDWKAQAQAEKEAAEQSRGAEAGPTAAPSADRRDAGPTAPSAAAGPLPPPTLDVLATTLAMQAMVALGLVPNPATGTTEVQLEPAKYLIDTIQMLQNKTDGNRTAEESAALEHLLYELRLGYLAVAEKAKSEAAGSP